MPTTTPETAPANRRRGKVEVPPPDEAEIEQGARTILSLSVTGFKRIDVANITLKPEGATVIGGENGQGKTSALDALECVLSGGRAIPARPVREGAREASIIARLPGFVVKRVIQPNRETALEVTRPDGVPLDRPQQFLDGLVGAIAFDPLEFDRMSPKAQAETLSALVGLDLSDLDREKSKVFTQRTAVGREKDRLKGHAESLNHYEHAPDEFIDVSILEQAVKDAIAHNGSIAKMRSELDYMRDRHERNAERMKALREEMAALLQSQGELLSNAKAKKAEIEGAGPPKSTEDLLLKVDEAATTNRQVVANKARAEAYAEYDARQSEYDALSDQLADIQQTRRARLAAVAFPVPGLAFTEDGDVLFNGLPVEQASGAERLRLSVAIAMAANPTLKIALIRDGSLLDAGNMLMVDDLVRSAGGQILVERVGVGSETHVVLKDGIATEVVP